MPDTIEPTLTSLRRRRGSVQSTITTFVKKLDQWRDNEQNRDPYFLQASLETMQRAFGRFPDIQDELEERDEAEIEKRDPIQTSYESAVARARRYLREDNSQSDVTSRASTPMRTQTIPVTLPAITLPTFDGSVEGWASFYDIFSSLIDRNNDLPPVRKLQYLRLSLAEKAARSIQSLETTDQNYEIALSILKKKYECTRRTLRRHWAILREYPRLPKDTPSGLSQLVDAIHQHVRALENLGAPVESWDIPLIDLILTKINSNTAWQWELTLTDNAMPSYKNLLTFLEKRANCVEFSTTQEGPTASKTNPQRQEHKRNQRSGSAPVQAFAISNATSADNKASTSRTTSCVICSGSHPIYRCDKFHALSLEDRQRVATKSSLCFNCLARGHDQQECRSEIVCRKCKRRHHSLLHRSWENTQPPTEPGRSADNARSEESAQQA